MDETSHGIPQQLSPIYMMQRDGWNIVSLIRYNEVRELLDHPKFMCNVF
jgi:hypothetical protein